MRLQVSPPSPEPPQRSTVEFFSFRQSFVDSRSSSPTSTDSLEFTSAQSLTPKAPSFVPDRYRAPDKVRGRELNREDPVARLQRECSSLRLRLATAPREREKAALTRKRPESISTASSKTVVASDAGTRAPPSSARTPPSAPLIFPVEVKEPSTGYNTATEFFSSTTTTTTRKDTGETVTFTRTQVTQVRSPPLDSATPTLQKQIYERWLPGLKTQQDEQPQPSAPRRQPSQRQPNQAPAVPQQAKRGQQHQPPPHQNLQPPARQPQSSRSPTRRVSDNHPPAHESHSRRGRRSHGSHPNRRSYTSTTSAASAPSPATSPPPLPVPAPGMPGYESPPPRRMKPAEMAKQLERSLREVQELLRARDKEVEMLKRERDRVLLERDREKEKRMEVERRADAEKGREYDALKKELDAVRRDRDRLLVERDRDRERERERDRERERERRDRERRERNNFRRTRSQAPSSFYSSLTAETETLVHAQSLDVFLTKTDSWSGAQVIQAVEDLNAEITHFAASATESCVFVPRAAAAPRRRSRSGQPPPGPQATMPIEDALETAPWLSSSLVKILTTHEHSTDPLLVQLALQASVATCCARSMSLFCVGFPAKLDGLLGRIYGQMASAEPQPTSSRWRALTHRSIRSLYPGLEEYAVSELVSTMLRWAAAVFDVSGCSPKDKSDASNSTLRSQLRRIAEAVYKLSLVTREDILSTNFEVMLVESGVPFDGVSMCNAFVDAHDAADSKGGDKVLCTTELGLKCTTRRGKASSERDSADETFERRTLLQPKVVLEEAVDAILA